MMSQLVTYSQPNLSHKVNHMVDVHYQWVWPRLFYSWPSPTPFIYLYSWHWEVFEFAILILANLFMFMYKISSSDAHDKVEFLGKNVHSLYWWQRYLLLSWTGWRTNVQHVGVFDLVGCAVTHVSWRPTEHLGIVAVQTRWWTESGI